MMMMVVMVQVVKDLVASFPIITSKDDQGNTALHVAAYGGHLSVVEILVREAPSMEASLNNHGDTFLHTAVAGFRSPGFRRLEKHIELMKQLTRGNVMNIHDIIHLRNHDGRTALHVAVMENIPCSVVELLMSVPSIDLNNRDCDGMTPLDLLKQRPRSVSSEILIKQLIPAGATHHNSASSSIVSHLRSHCISRSPGTSFRIPDTEIFLYTGLDNVASCEQECEECNTCSGELTNGCDNNSLCKNKSGYASYANRRLRFLLRWSRKKKAKETSNELEDDDCLESLGWRTHFQTNLIPLRQRYSKFSSLPNSHPQSQNTLSDLSYHPSLTAKRKFAAGLMHGVIQVIPQVVLPSQSPCSPFSGSSMASPFT